jgi:acyl transferase domain-containing protein
MGTDRTGSCAIGSVKTNIGHTDAAAGVIGLIKTVLMLKHRQIPPSLHFSQPNPKIDFANSPFYVNTALAEWKTSGGPRRAGVSAFGAGGTNAHAILEEAPSVEPAGSSRPWHLLALSAKSPAALDRVTAQLADHLRHHPDTPPADIAYTLQVGRQAFQHRRIVVGRDTSDLVAALEASPNQAGLSALWSGHEPQVVFMFPGGGAQYVHMGRDLYATEPVFREEVRRCAALLRPQLHQDLCDVLYPAPGRAEEAAGRLRQPLLGLSALFVTEYALAKLWMSWGIRPQAMIGHSLGEYTAACLAGVMSLEDALAMVVRRGQLMEEIPAGAMLSVPLPEHEVRPLLTPRIALAAVNGPAQCVVSGETAAIDLLAAELAAKGVQCRLLPINVASHSAMVAPILESFGAFVATLRLQPPAIPYLSNVTGTWITATEPTAPRYWMQHLRQTVHFHAAAQALLEVSNRVFLEVGPGRTLSSLVRQQAGETAGALTLSSLRHPTEEQSDVAFLMTALGKLWMAGVPVTWEGLYTHERRRRCALPTYPFERQRYWIEARPERIRAEMLISSMQETAAGTPQQPPSDSSAAPRTETERRLVALWRGMLGTARIGIHDNFFELGGDSLIAIQLLAKVRETFQTNLPLHSLLQAPTIAELAAQIEPAGPDSADAPAVAGQPQLVEIQPGGARRPIFFIHPVGGGVYPYQSIAQMLAGERPVYGIQAQGFDGQAEPLTCIKEMATHYNTLIRAVQPEGPYLLAGASFGGVVAFEMAQQLTVSGQKVGLLALLDSPAPERIEAYITDEASIVASVLNVDAELPAIQEELRQLEPEAQLQVCFERARASGSISADADIETFRRPVALLKTHIQALLDYQPQPYPGDLVFFRAAERDPLNPPHPEYGWMEYVGGGIIIYEVPGNHDSMLVQPNVRTLVERLRWHLKIADQGAL